MYTNIHKIGSSIESIINKGSSQNNKKVINSIKAELAYNRQTLISLMRDKGILSKKEISKYSNNFTPSVDLDNNISTFRMVIPNDIKAKYLNLNTNGIDILGKMNASIAYDVNSEIQNKAILDELYKQMNEDSIKANLYRDKNELNPEYVLLTRDSPNKFVKQVMDIIPAKLRKEIEKGDGLLVRREALAILFGVKDISLANLIPNKNEYIKIKRGIQIAEQVLITLATLSKQAYIIKTPAVLIGNIISNINVSLMKGRNIAKVFLKTFRALQDTKQYLEINKKILEIELKQQIGTVTKEDLNKLTYYKDTLATSSVHELMKAGMFQSVVEDMDVTGTPISTLGKNIANRIKLPS